MTARPVDPEDAYIETRNDEATPGVPFEGGEPVAASRAVGVGAPTVIESNGEPVVVQSSSDSTVLVEPGGDDAPAHRRNAPVDAPPAADDTPSARAHHPDPVRPGAESAPVPAASHVVSEAPAATETSSPVAAPTPVSAPAAVHDESASTATGPAQPVAPAPATQTVYVQQPVPPRKKGNRGFGVLASIIGTIVFGLVWALVAAAVIALSTSSDRFADSMSTFVSSAAFLTPIVVFLVAMLLLALLVNRGGWPWYIIGGFVVGVLVYGGYLAGGLITVASRITQDEVPGFLTSVAITPLAIAAGVAAREVALWTGLLISARGKRVKARNHEARATFDREQADRVPTA